MRLIGISCPNLSFLPFSDVLEDVRRAFKLWEIVGELEHDLPKIKDDIRYGIDSYGMNFQIHGPIADLNLGSPSDRMRIGAVKELTLILQICDELGIKMATIHPGAAIAYGESVKERVRDATRKSMRDIDHFIRGMELKVALENMPEGTWSIGYDYDELLSLIEGTEIGMCFDIGHANITRTIETFLSGGNDKIINVHLHNNEGMVDQHFVLDNGTIDIPSILSKLREKYKGNYIIESLNLKEGIQSKTLLERWIGGQSGPE